MSNVSKIVVIDLDETLGYFIEFGIFWIGLHKYFLQLKTKLVMDQTYFNALIELYPEFFRPNILKILKTIILKILKKILFMEAHHYLLKLMYIVKYYLVIIIIFLHH